MSEAQNTSGEFYAEPYEPMEMGAYEARLIKIVSPEKDGPYGPQYEWYFEVLDPDYEGQEIKAFSSRSFTPNSKARQWVSAIIGHEVQEGERFSFGDLTGKRVTLHIGHNKTERGTFEKVEGLSPVRKRKRQQAQPEPAEVETDADAGDDEDVKPPF